MNTLEEKAADLHKNIPPDWYFRSIKENILQRYWHRRRFEEIGKLIEPTGGIILDIGSADGVFTKVILDKSNADVIYGIDVLKSSVEWAKKHWRNNKHLSFSVGDAHKLKYGNGKFDAVFALEVLEHVFDPREVFEEVRRVMKKGGYAVFLVPTDNFLFRIIWFVWLKFRGKIWKKTHIQTYRKDYLPKLSRKLGFVVETDNKFILGMLQAVKVRKV